MADINVRMLCSLTDTRKQFRSCHIWKDVTCVTLVYYNPGSGGSDYDVNRCRRPFSLRLYKKNFCYHCLQSKHFRAAFWNPLQLGTEGVTPVNAFTHVWPWQYLSLCNQNIRSVGRNCYRCLVVQTRLPTLDVAYKTCFCIYFWQQRAIVFLLLGLYYQQTDCSVGSATDRLRTE
jgi:hypothetical protein